MRICQIIESASGGSGKVAGDLAIEQSKRHDVTFIYAPGRADRALIARLKAHPALRLVPLSMRRAVGLHDVSALLRVYICLRRLGPFDVIHSHSSKAGALARIAGLFLPGRQIYTPHAFYSMQKGAKSFYGRAEIFLSHFSDAVTVSSSMEERHAREELGINPKKLFLVPNGIDLNGVATREAARRTMGYGENDVVVGFVGRFVPQKNLPRLIESFAIAAAKNAALQIALVVDGNEMEIKPMLAMYGIDARAKFFTRHRGRDLMPGFDVLLCSSDYEGFPIIFLEALAAGTPIVTTPVGGAAEAVIEGETGFIGLGFTAPDLANSLLQWASLAPAEQGKMRQNAQKHAGNFTLERMDARMQCAYSRLRSSPSQI